MENPNIVMVNEKCQTCDEHKTLLGNLVSCVKGIYGSAELESFSKEEKLELIKVLFAEFGANSRTRLIQSYKKENIGTINKERR